MSTATASTLSHPVLAPSSSHLIRSVKASSRRSSSWDRSGANHDWITVHAGETITLMEHAGPGCITHFYAAMIMPAITDYRDAIIRCYWDGETDPSVEVPLGDFFGLSHARIREYSNQMITVNPGYGGSHGLNCYLPMPFAEHARVTLEHRGETSLGGRHEALWFHIDYETYDEPLPSDVLRLHARYHQERPTEAIGDEPNVTLHDAANLDGKHNYVALDTQGHGQMVGLHLEINNLAGGWYGEGDDMVFVDDNDSWPPAIHGTGTEEIFGGGACPNVEYAGPYTGFHLIEHPNFDGLVGMYRWYVHDPIRFQKSLRWTLEHGHANNFANEYASVAYWYQDPSTSAGPELPGRTELLPPLPPQYAELQERVFDHERSLGGVQNASRTSVLAAFYRGDWDTVEELLKKSGA